MYIYIISFCLVISMTIYFQTMITVKLEIVYFPETFHANPI